jgi:hypothetical protein
MRRPKIPWHTMWIELALTTPFRIEPGLIYKAKYNDSNFAGMQVGWKEIVLPDSDTAKITGGRKALNQNHISTMSEEQLA